MYLAETDSVSVGCFLESGHGRKVAFLDLLVILT